MKRTVLFWPLFIVISALAGFLLWIIPGVYAPTPHIGGPVEISITIPEGKTVAQVATILVAKHLASTPKEVLDASRGILKSNEFAWIDPNATSLEGYLFPDTYRVYREENPKKVLEIMLKNFERKVLPAVTQELARQQASKAGVLITAHWSLSQIITLASIVERESTQGERARIADIFLRRIDAGIPLQADSTVNYATGNSKPAVSLAETSISSPYNTYRYKGLPPGPIANPGLAAIWAVLAPKANNNWYFLSTKQGAIIYSKTLEEHNKNKALYLK